MTTNPDIQEGHLLAPEGPGLGTSLRPEVRERPDVRIVVSDKTEGQRILLLVDGRDVERGELVWRIASGHTVEICEFFIHREEDQRKGWGTRLLNEPSATG